MTEGTYGQCKALSSRRFPLIMQVATKVLAVEWALAFLGCMKHLAQKPCIALDIDGTVLLNSERGPSKCVLHFQSLVEACAQHGVDVFCITARPDEPENREYTMRQLEKCKITPVNNVYMRPPAAEYAGYKFKAREDIVAQGYRILLTIGDQWADISLKDAPSDIEDDKTYVGQLGDKFQFGIKLPSEFA